MAVKQSFVFRLIKNYMGSTHRQADKVSYANGKYGIKKPNVKPKEKKWVI